jgi:serine/threonine protein kinase
MGNSSSTIFPENIIREEIRILKSLKLCALNDRELMNDLLVALNSLTEENYEQIQTKFFSDQIDIKVIDKAKTAVLDNINEFELATELEQRFFDYRVIKLAVCVFGNLWITDKKFFKATSIIKNYFRVSENLSTGVWGLVFKGIRGGSSLSFIVKSQQRLDFEINSIHEIFIGFTAINNLRIFCPNFSCVYGGFICGDSNGLEGKICSGDNDTPYVVSEYIEGESYYHTIKKYHDIRMVSIHKSDRLYGLYEIILSGILQVVFALKIAYARGFQFSHRDLHDRNIMNRPLNSKKLIRYDSRYFIQRDAELITKNVRQENLYSKEPREIYYVKSEYVSTIIDYDTAQIFLPIKSSTDDYELVRFGQKERDKFSEAFYNSPENSEIRDLIKFLGFTTYNCMFMILHDDFKEMMTDLYFDFARPYLQQARKLTLTEKKNLLEVDRNGFFNLTKNQIPYIESQRINYDSFMETFDRVVPKHYRDAILFTSVLNPTEQDSFTYIDKTPELNKLDEEASKKLFAPVLTCDEQCLNPNTLYEKVMTHHPSRELNYFDNDELENLAHHATRIQNSRVLFNRSSVKVATRVDGYDDLPNPIEYRTLIDLRYKALLKEYRETQNLPTEKIQRLIGYNLGKAKSINSIHLPSIKNFGRINSDQEDQYVYRDQLLKVFEYIYALRNAIALNNGLVFLMPDSAGQNRQLLISAATEVENFYKNILIPWRTNLMELVDSGRLSNTISDSIRLNIVDKIEDNLNIDAIY